MRRHYPVLTLRAWANESFHHSREIGFAATFIGRHEGVNAFARELKELLLLI